MRFNDFHRINRKSINSGLLRMNSRITAGAVAGILLGVIAFYFAPVNLLTTWEGAATIGALILVTIANVLQRIFGPRVITKPHGTLLFRLYFGFFSSLYGFASGAGIAFMTIALKGSQYGIALTATLLFGCAVGVSTFAFDLLICHIFLIGMLAPSIYVNIWVIPGAHPTAFTCTVAVLFFLYLARSLHTADITVLANAEDVEEKTNKLRESRDAIEASNNLFENTINSIGEIFLTLDINGVCFGNISDKTETQLHMKPTGRHFTDILHLQGEKRTAATSWFAAISRNQKFFTALVSQGPDLWIDTEKSRTFKVRYFWMQADGKFKAIIMTLADITKELESNRIADELRHRASFILGLAENRQAFVNFIIRFETFSANLMEWNGTDLESIRQELHTMKGTAAVFHMTALADEINELEMSLRRLGETVEAPLILMRTSAKKISRNFTTWMTSEKFIFERLRVFKSHEFSFGIDREGFVEQNFARQSQEVVSSIRQTFKILKAQDLKTVLDSFNPHLQRVADSLNKQVKLTVEIPPESVLLLNHECQAIAQAMIHIINNAIDHGIETSEDRAAASKGLIGSIRAYYRASKSYVSVFVEDDGRGIDTASLRVSLRAKNIAADSLDEAAVLKTILQAGFTTREQATIVSGHGLGLSALNELVVACGGSIEISTRPGAGTLFEIRIPRRDDRIAAIEIGDISLLLRAS